MSVKVIITFLHIFSGLIIPCGFWLPPWVPLQEVPQLQDDKNVSGEHMNVGHKFQVDFVLLSCKSLVFIRSQILWPARLKCLRLQDSYQRNGLSIYLVTWTHNGHKRPLAVKDLHLVGRSLDSAGGLTGTKPQLCYFLTVCLDKLFHLLAEGAWHTGF